MTPLFTAHDAWTGGSIDALLLFPLLDHEELVAVATTLWSDPRLSGPYEHSDVEPEQQERVHAIDATMLQTCSFLYGVMSHADGRRTPCSQYTLHDDAWTWIYLGVPLGSLPETGAYPLTEDTSGKIVSLIEELRNMSDRIASRHPVRGTIYGWLTASECDQLQHAVSASEVPEERWHGISLWSPAPRFFPQNQRGPLVTIG